MTQSHAQSALLYIGTYSAGGSNGIYVARMDLKTGALSPAELAAETMHPTFLAIHPNRKWLYSVNEIGNFRGIKSGSLSAFSVNDDGKLTPLNQQASMGGGAAFVAVHPAGNFAFAANYGGGTAAMLPIAEDGTLGEATSTVQHYGSGPNTQRQEKPHPHSINIDPSGKFAIVADLGIDKLMIYRLDLSAGKLISNEPASASVQPGSGPRHIAFDPGGKFAYVVNEMGNTVTAFTWDSDRGIFSDFQTLSTLPAGFNGENTAAEVQMHPSGKFLYASNRGHQSIAIFSVDQATGKLNSLGHQPCGGKHPRNFAIDPTGQFIVCANRETLNLVVFRIDPASGNLKETGVSIDVPSAVCVRFLVR